MGRGYMDTDRNRKIIRLFEDGIPQNQIAVDLGLTYGVVRNTIYEARRAGVVAPRTYRPENPDPDRAWQRLRAELAETHRREFVRGLL